LLPAPAERFCQARWGQHRGQLVDPDRPGGGGDATVRRDLQHVTQAVAADAGPQPRVGAVNLVPGDPAGRNSSLDGPGDHVARQGGFRRELDAGRDAGGGAAVRVLGPRLRQVQRAVEKRVSPRGGGGQIDRHLSILDPTGGAGVLPLHTNAVHALLHVPALIDDQDRLGVAEVVDHIAAQVVPDRVGDPLRPRQQMLQPVRGRRSAVLGDRPTVLPIQTRHQALHQTSRVPKRLKAGEPRPDPVDHLAERLLPPIKVYARCRGHRRVLVVPHKQPMLARWPHPSPQDTPDASRELISNPDNELRLSY
jgi:hypothetical protein